MMELGIFSRTYEATDLEKTYRKMVAHGIRRVQLNLSSAGMPTLPDAPGEAKIERLSSSVEVVIAEANP